MVFLFICVLKNGRCVCVINVDNVLVSYGWLYVVLIIISGCLVVRMVVLVWLSVVGGVMGCFSGCIGMIVIFFIFLLVMFFGSFRWMGLGWFFIVMWNVLCIVVGMEVGLMI